MGCAASEPTTEEFCVGPIWGNTEAKEKADKWIAKNRPNEGWKFTGQWESRPCEETGEMTS